MGIKFTNNAVGVLASSITSTATTIFVAAGQGAYFPAPTVSDYFFATLIDSSNNLEIVKVTARTTDTLTVVRGQDGTVARAYAAGDKIELRVVAAALTEMIQRDGTVPFTGSVNAGSNKVINVTNPTSAQDAATKAYVDTQTTAETTARTSAISTLTSNLAAEVTRATNSEALKAPLTGVGATGTWPINVSGSAGSAGSVGWTGVSGRPTHLSQFTNDLGNYLGAVTGVEAGGYDNSSNNCSGGFNCGFELQRSGNTIRLHQNNCNCNCNCSNCGAGG